MTRVLLDSGVTKNHNIGEIALLEVTRSRFKHHDVTVVNADQINILKNLIKCNVYVFVSGGLLKNAEPKFLARKLLAVAVARLLRKQIFIDTQTVFLNGFWRLMFKMVFKGLPLLCRDKYSLQDSWNLGLTAVLKKELLLKPYVAVDTRFCQYGEEVVNFVNNLLLNCSLPKVDVPTMHTNKEWREVAEQFSNASFSVCASYHALVFSLNGFHSVLFITNQEWKDYYQYKLAGIK